MVGKTTVANPALKWTHTVTTDSLVFSVLNERYLKLK